MSEFEDDKMKSLSKVLDEAEAEAKDSLIDDCVNYEMM